MRCRRREGTKAGGRNAGTPERQAERREPRSASGGLRKQTPRGEMTADQRSRIDWRAATREDRDQDHRADHDGESDRRCADECGNVIPRTTGKRHRAKHRRTDVHALADFDRCSRFAFRLSSAKQLRLPPDERRIRQRRLFKRCVRASSRIALATSFSSSGDWRLNISVAPPACDRSRAAGAPGDGARARAARGCCRREGRGVAAISRWSAPFDVRKPDELTLARLEAREEATHVEAQRLVASGRAALRDLGARLVLVRRASGRRQGCWRCGRRRRAARPRRASALAGGAAEDRSPARCRRPASRCRASARRSRAAALPFARRASGTRARRAVALGVDSVDGGVHVWDSHDLGPARHAWDVDVTASGVSGFLRAAPGRRRAVGHRRRDDEADTDRQRDDADRR